MKITICGSMTTAKKMIDIAKALEGAGHDVVLPEFTEEYAGMDTLDNVHSESVENKLNHDLIRGYFEEIKDSDAILVINEKRNGVDNYIGGNSFLEMGFAHVLGKKIFLLNDMPDMLYRDEIMAMKPVVIHGDLDRIK